MLNKKKFRGFPKIRRVQNKFQRISLLRSTEVRADT